MKRLTLPKPDTRSYALLQALLAGPATFYQAAERAGFDIEAPGIEHRLRMIFARGIQGHARLDGILYVLKEASRDAMLGITSPPQGQVASPHFHGLVGAMAVLLQQRHFLQSQGWKSEFLQLFKFEGFNTFKKHYLSIIAIQAHLRKKSLNFLCGWKGCFIERHFSPFIKCTEDLHNFDQPIHHFIGAQFVRRNCARCALRLLKGKFSSKNGGANFIRIRCRQTPRNHFKKLLQLCCGSIYYCGRCIRPSKQCSFICVNQELGSVLILPTHNIYCYAQRRDRAYRLHPARPIGFREFVVISQYGDIDDAKKHEEDNRQVGIFHALAESYLKGIIS